MSAYEPPIENVPEFDVLLFRQDDTPLTIGTASKLFLRYPNAQGEENLAKTNVSGLLTANGGIDVDTIDGIAVGNTLNIGTEASRTGQINIGTGTTTGRSIQIGSTAGLSGTTSILGRNVSIGNSSTVSMTIQATAGSDINVATSTVGGALNLSTSATRSGAINIGNGASATGAVNIGTVSNTDINISGKTINVSGGGGFPININTTGITLVQGTAGTNIRSSSNTMNIADNNTSGTVNIATSDTRSGVLNIGTGLTRTAAADINIGTGTNNAGHLHLQDGNNNSGNVHIANGTFNTGNVNIANGAGTGSVIGQQNQGDVNILTGAYNRGDCNISTSATGVGDVFIGNSANTTGKLYLNNFNIDIGTNGAPTSVISLNAPLQPNYTGTQPTTTGSTAVGYIETITATGLANLGTGAPAIIGSFTLGNGVWQICMRLFFSSWVGGASDWARFGASKSNTTTDASRLMDLCQSNISGSVNIQYNTIYSNAGSATIYIYGVKGTGSATTTSITGYAVRIA